jgi:hypothetical protein
VRASYFDPLNAVSVETDVESAEDLKSLLDQISALTTSRGRPTLELLRDDGSSLALSSDGRLGFLVFTNSLGESFHSSGGKPGRRLIFDYFGSWSEAPSEALIAFSEAFRSAVEFLREGTPETEAVLFEPD